MSLFGRARKAVWTRLPPWWVAAIEWTRLHGASRALALFAPTHDRRRTGGSCRAGSQSRSSDAEPDQSPQLLCIKSHHIVDAQGEIGEQPVEFTHVKPGESLLEKRAAAE